MYKLVLFFLSICIGSELRLAQRFMQSHLPQFQKFVPEVTKISYDRNNNQIEFIVCLPIGFDIINFNKNFELKYQVGALINKKKVFYENPKEFVSVIASDDSNRELIHRVKRNLLYKMIIKLLVVKKIDNSIVFSGPVFLYTKKEFKKIAT